MDPQAYRRSPQLVQGPRWVPLLVRLRLLFGGFFSQFGWMFFGFGMIFVWVFAGHVDWSFARFRGPVVTAPGIVTSSTLTNGSENHQAIYEIGYTFTGTDGHSYHGESYTLGSGKRVGSKVTVEYIQAKPQTSRIQGARGGVFPPVVLLVTIFPLIGLFCILVGLRTNHRGLRLLKYGRLAQGTLIEKTPTSTRINDKIVYRYKFSFAADDGHTYEAIGRTQTGLLEDEAQEPLLYDPADPRYSIMLGALPGDPRIDDQGHVQVRSAWLNLGVFVIPLISLVGHGWWLMHLMR